MAEPVIQTHQLTKVFYHPFFYWKVRARAVTQLDLNVSRGEVFGLLGPNGSGKSTTIKILLGLLFPTSGQAAVFGKRPTDVPTKTRIGFLPEESYLYRFLDAEETLDFFGRLFSLPAIERRRRTDMLLEMTGLSRERHRPLAEFSKGMTRRVGIASSLINDPELVILDEPTTGLDPLGTREVKDLILELRRKGKTVLLSSHLLSDVEDVCDRVSILYGGRARAEGRMQDLLRREDRAQITAPMDEALAREAVAFLRGRLGDGADIVLQPPAERLENYFLRIVREAQAQRAVTSGVGGGTGGQLDFLTEKAVDEAEGLLDRLRLGSEEAPPAEDPGAGVRLSGEGEALQAAGGLLADLASGQRDADAAREADKAEDALASAEDDRQPNASLLEQLGRKE